MNNNLERPSDGISNNFAIFTDFLKRIFKDIKLQFLSLNNLILPPYLTYYNRYEIDTRKKRGLCDIVNAKNFRQRYLNLMKGLSDKDKYTLFTIIKRLTMLKNISRPTDIYTPEEKKLLTKVEEFRKSIIPLEDGTFCYKDYFLPINNFEVGTFLYEYGIHLLEHKERIKGTTILDIGGFIGDSALILNKLNPATIYSFEPVKSNYNLMLKTIELNGMSNVVPINCGVGDSDTIVDIYEDNSASSIDTNMLYHHTNIEKCKIIRIDDFMEDKNMEIGLIKVDIEGYEQNFLRGSLQTIKTHRPVLLLSIYHNVNDLLDIKPFIESLDLGYSFKIFKPIDGSISGEILLICEPE